MFDRRGEDTETDLVQTENGLTYQPRRIRWNEAWIAFLSCAVPGGIVSLALGSPWGYLTAGVAAVGAVTSVRRAFRIEIAVTNERVIVANYWRTYVLPWADVDAVGVALKRMGVLPQPALGFRRHVGPPRFAQATPFRHAARRDFQAAVLTFAPSSVLALPDAAGVVGSDSAPTELLRRWSRRNRSSDNPFPVLLLPAGALALIGIGIGSAVLIGAPSDNAGALAYVVGGLLVAGGALASAGFAFLLSTFVRQRRTKTRPGT